MPIPFSCPQCGKKLKAPDDAVGKTSRCPGCGAAVTCPEPIYDAELVDPPTDGAEPIGGFGAGQEYVPATPGAGGPAPVSPAETRRPCPMCGELIVATAAKCRFCGEIFDPAIARAKKSGRYRQEDDELSAGDITVALLCGWIGCITGIVWMVQGKQKGWKMLLLSFVATIVWAVVGSVLSQSGGPR